MSAEKNAAAVAAAHTQTSVSALAPKEATQAAMVFIENKQNIKNIKNEDISTYAKGFILVAEKNQNNAYSVSYQVLCTYTPITSAASCMQIYWLDRKQTAPLRSNRYQTAAAAAAAPVACAARWQQHKHWEEAIY